MSAAERSMSAPSATHATGGRHSTRGPGRPPRSELTASGLYPRLRPPEGPSIELEDPPNVAEGIDEAVDLLARVVDCEARSGGRRHSEPVHQDLSAVVAGANADRVPVEDLRDVVAVDVLELEGDDPGSIVAQRRAEDAQAGNLTQALQRVRRELDLVRMRRVQPDRVE